MGLIKSPNAPVVAMVPFSMKDIENHARAVLARARQQAEELLAEAQAEGERLKVAAKAEGLAAGRIEGLAKGLEDGRKSGAQQALNEQKAQLANVVKGLTQAAMELDASRRKLEADALAEVVELAAAVARRVTKRQGVIDPGVLAANLGEAMKLVVSASDVRIAVHPAQRQLLLDALPKLQMTWPSLKHVQLVDDPKIAPGGCRVYTARGEVDADLDGQLDRVIGDLLPQPRSADDADAHPPSPGAPGEGGGEGDSRA
jgi:flagellar assembly protein FliH